MKKLLFTSLGVLVVFLFVLSFISVETISKPEKPFFDKTLQIDHPDVCVPPAHLCSSEGIIITPPGGGSE